MMLALNEVGGMALKAARGAGIPLGQSEDLAKTAIYLAGTSGDIAPVTAALTEPMVACDVRWAADQITIHTGSAALIGPIIRDAFAMGCGQATLATLDHAAFVAAILAENGIALTWHGAELARSDTSIVRPQCKAVQIPADDWQIWLDLAARTYVPQSEESRLAGAGAGLNDND